MLVSCGTLSRNEIRVTDFAISFLFLSNVYCCTLKRLPTLVRIFFNILYLLIHFFSIETSAKKNTKQSSYHQYFHSTFSTLSFYNLLAPSPRISRINYQILIDHITNNFRLLFDKNQYPS